MRRGLLAVGLLLAVQVAIFGVWYAVERERVASGERLQATAVERRATAMDEPVPDLEFRRPTGARRRLSETRGRPLVLHFWATWCLPCRQELPALLEFAAKDQIPVLAVSVDEDWAAVRGFLGDDLPRTVVLAKGEDADLAFNVRQLPATFVVTASGVLRLRLDGAQDWRDSALHQQVTKAAR